MRHTSFPPTPPHPRKRLHNLFFTQSLSVIASADLEARVGFFFGGLLEFSLISLQLKSFRLAQALKLNYYKYTKDCYVDQDVLATLVPL